jgi:uncharacterized protein (DUF2147 family)
MECFAILKTGEGDLALLMCLVRLASQNGTLDWMGNGSFIEAKREKNLFWRNAMFKVVGSHGKKHWFLLLLPLVLLCGCSSLGASQAAPTATVMTNQASLAATAAANQAPVAATVAAQTVLQTYVGTWQVHDSVLTIHANGIGLEQWNAGPCGNTMCGGNAQITFTVNTDGSLKGTIQSVTYSQANGTPAPAGYQPASADDPQAGYTFQLQHSDVHLLYTTWFGQGSSLNNNNRYWCGSGASQAERQKCGA